MSNKYQELFYKSTRANNIKLFKALLKDTRVDPSDCNNWAIRWANSNGHLEVVKVLEEAIANKVGKTNVKSI